MLYVGVRVAVWQWKHDQIFCSQVEVGIVCECVLNVDDYGTPYWDHKAWAIYFSNS